MPESLRRKVGGRVIEATFRSLAAAGRLHPKAAPERYGIEVLRDIAYGPDSAHRLDVWRPSGPNPRAAVLYLHGGGFRILSKETHWLMALAYARAGYIVFNVEYRLAPAHPFPAAIADACRAYTWLFEHGRRYGADVGRLVLAGESAGANLAASLALACAYEREEPWARQVFDTGVAPRAVVAACGMLEVSNPERLWSGRRVSIFVQDRIREVSDAYLRGADPVVSRALADPVVTLERGDRPDRPLPPFFAPVGTRDPVLDDTRRLARALGALEVRCDAVYYEGEVHAFHAFVWRDAARRCWVDTFGFLDDVLGF